MTLTVSRSQNRRKTKRTKTQLSKRRRRVVTKLDRRIAGYQEAVRVLSPKLASGYHRPGSQNRNKH